MEIIVTRNDAPRIKSLKFKCGELVNASLTNTEEDENKLPLSLQPNFIIYAPSYDELSGGITVLHKLCDLINELGYSAKIWPYHHVPLLRFVRGSGFKFALIRTFKNIINSIRGRGRKNFRLGQKKHDKTVLAGLQDLRDNTIVIYPEIVYGNPLDAKNVVRWWLYKRKFPPREKRAEVSELYFHYSEAYLDKIITANGTTLFSLSCLAQDKYKKLNFGARRGYCHIVRKGKSRPLDQHPEDSILIDGLTHEETAKVFNEVEYCVSYDLHTMLALLAALCGCKVMIVPEKDVTLDDWEPDEKHRYGLAYGEENRSWAENTKHLIIGEMQKAQKQDIEMTKRFLYKCISHFK